MSAAHLRREGQEPLPNSKQLLDTDMSGLQAGRELAGNINTGTVRAPAQRRSIRVQNHNPRRGDKATGGLSNRQGSPPTQFLKRSFIEAHPATRVTMALRKQGGTPITLLVVAQAAKKSTQMQPSQGGRSIATGAKPAEGAHLTEGHEALLP